MKDPKRWKETEGGVESDLVRGLSTVRPAPRIREQMWREIASTLPPGTGGAPSGGEPAGGAAAPSSPAGLSVGAKLLIVSLPFIGAIGVVGWTLSSKPPPAPRPAASAPATATQDPQPHPPPAEPPALAKADESGRTASPPTPSRGRPKDAASPAGRTIPRLAPTADIATSPTITTATATATATHEDRLREEAEGLRRARRSLRAQDPEAALAELDRLGSRFPAGPLEEEREVLTIEALFAAGRTDVAKRRAEHFLLERPLSVHAARVRNLAQHPDSEKMRR